MRNPMFAVGEEDICTKKWSIQGNDRSVLVFAKQENKAKKSCRSQEIPESFGRYKWRRAEGKEVDENVLKGFHS